MLGLPLLESLHWPKFRQGDEPLVRRGLMSREPLVLFRQRSEGELRERNRPACYRSGAREIHRPELGQRKRYDYHWEIGVIDG